MYIRYKRHPQNTSTTEAKQLINAKSASGHLVAVNKMR